MDTNKLLILFITLTISLSSVAAIENTLSEPQQQYVKSYVKAMNSSDLALLTEITHQSYLNCINSSNEDFYSTIFNRDLAREVPNDYSVTFEKLSESQIQTETTGALKRGLPYPTAPSHQVIIDFQKGESAFVTISRFLVLEDDQYFQVGSCPNAKMLERFREIERRKIAQQKKARTLALNIDAKLLEEITQLLRAGNKLQAWRLYSKKTGESLSMAKLVVANFNV